MGEITWIKLKTEMFSDEKIRLIESMPEADTILIIWIKLLVQAGKTNANGYIFLNDNVPFTAEMISTLFNRPLTIIRLALKVLSDFGMIAIDNEGKILIENWTKHQNVESLEKIKEQTRIRVAKFREKQKNDDDIKENRIDKKRIESNVTSNVTELRDLFEIFRKKYPGTKRGLDTEFTYFQEKINDWKNVINILLPAIEKQIQYHDLLKSKNMFSPNWKHLKTWLYNRSWEEEITIRGNITNNDFIPLSERMD